MSVKATGTFTGRHMTAIMVSFFGVVIAVNVYMAREASSTFGGVVVENSYVASQHFNRWLGEAADERALGWQAHIARHADNRVAVDLTGEGTQGASVTAIARHPLGRQADRALSFTETMDGLYVSREALPPGRWRLRIEVKGAASSGARLWRSERDVR